jgi:hypothetical protein
MSSSNVAYFAARRDVVKQQIENKKSCAISDLQSRAESSRRRATSGLPWRGGRQSEFGICGSQRAAAGET